MRNDPGREAEHNITCWRGSVHRSLGNVEARRYLNGGGILGRWSSEPQPGGHSGIRLVDCRDNDVRRADRDARQGPHDRRIGHTLTGRTTDETKPIPGKKESLAEDPGMIVL